MRVALHPSRRLKAVSSNPRSRHLELLGRRCPDRLVTRCKKRISLGAGRVLDTPGKSAGRPRVATRQERIGPSERPTRSRGTQQRRFRRRELPAWYGGSRRKGGYLSAVGPRASSNRRWVGGIALPCVGSDCQQWNRLNTRANLVLAGVRRMYQPIAARCIHAGRAAQDEDDEQRGRAAQE
jgi:hypothetical protein